MSLVLNEKLTDNVFGAVWLATLVLTYEEIVLQKNENVLFNQVEIQRVAQLLCKKKVHAPRVSQWCNGDHTNNNYNYLRATGTKRRLTQIGEFNHHREYPESFLKGDEIIFELPEENRKVAYRELFEWYCSMYSKIINLDQSTEDSIDMNEAILRNESKNKLHEDGMKVIIADYLHKQEWETQLSLGVDRGIDILAERDGDRWVIEVKGYGTSDKLRDLYFAATIGELMQKMNERYTKYSIALPDLQHYRHLWSKLPRLAKERSGITALFVNENKQIEEVN